MTKETNYGKLLQAMYDQGFADCEAAAKAAIENGIKKAILAEREACAKLCDEQWERDDCAKAIRERGEK